MTNGGNVSIGEGAQSITMTNVGLYSANIVIEYNTDQKVVKPVIKVNSLASKEEIDHAVEMAAYALRESVRALDSYDFTIPEPTKALIESKDIYKDNEEILNTKDGEVESHSQ